MPASSALATVGHTVNASSPLTDCFGRRIEYLRLSLTERCDLRCVYCRPSAEFPLSATADSAGATLSLSKGRPARGGDAAAADLLSQDDVVNIAEAALRLGLRRLRLTGGEPLLRDDLEEIIARLRQLPGLQDLALTTNGQRLGPRAARLAAAGLMRVNVSLDSLDPQTYAELTGGGDVAAVRRGLEAALAAGLSPVKVNVVLSSPAVANGDGLQDFAELVRRHPIHVRFIEAMPTCSGTADSREGDCLPAQQVLDRFAPSDQLTPVAGPAGGGPARYYRLNGSLGTVGIITPISQPFCSQCNRLRVSARGDIKPCLFSPPAADIPLRPALRGPDPVGEIMRLLTEAARRKPRCYREVAGSSGIPDMHAIGG